MRPPIKVEELDLVMFLEALVSADKHLLQALRDMGAPRLVSNKEPLPSRFGNTREEYALAAISLLSALGAISGAKRKVAEMMSLSLKGER